MKKSFKRFLSSVLATVMAVAGMSIGMATNVMAEDVTWISDGSTAAPSVLGAQYGTNTLSFSKTDYTATLNGFAFADGSSAVYGKTGIDSRSGLTQDETGLSSNPGYYMFFTPTQTGTLSLYYVRQSSNTNKGKIRVFKATRTETTTGYSYSFDNSSTGTDVQYDVDGNKLYDLEVGGCRADATPIDPLKISLTAGTSYAFYSNSSGLALMGVIFTPAATYTGSITGTVTGSADNTYTGKFTCNGDEFTVNEDGTYEIPNLANDTYTLAYEGTDYEMVSVNVTVSDQDTPVEQDLTLTAREQITYTWSFDTSGVPEDLDTSSLTFGTPTTTNVLENTLSYTGSNYTLKSDYATLVVGTNATLDSETKIITVAPTADWFEPVVEAQVITDKATLTFTADDVTDSFSADTDKTYCDYFTVHFTASKSAISATNRSVEGLGDYHYEYKTGSATGYISFTVSGPATVQVVARSSSGTAGNERTMNITDANGTYSDSDTIAVVGQSDTFVPTKLFALPSAGTYTIKSAESGINFFSVNVVVNSTSDATGGKIFADSADSYAVATLSTADLANAALNIAIGSYTDSTTDVFESAVIDGILMKASDFGASYIYVTKVEGANGETFDFTTDFTEAE